MKTTMKLMLLLVVAGITKFSSCKKNPQIVGKWECTNDVMIEGELSLSFEYQGNGDLVVSRNMDFKRL